MTAMADIHGKNKKRIALLSNVTVDLIVTKLRKEYDFYIPEGYDTWVQEAINPKSALYSSKDADCIDAVIILLDGTEARSWKGNEGHERLNLWKQAVTALTNKITVAPVFISTIDIRENRIKSYSENKMGFELEHDWYSFLLELMEGKDNRDARSNVFILDIADVIADLGRNQFYSNKMWYMSSMPYSRDGLNAVTLEISRALNAAFSSRKKIIALDLDNTLWGGVIGEDGLEGIELSDHKEGQRYYDFQRQLLEMKKRGILLALNSKNNLEDAESVLQNHPAMLLRDEDFVSKKINWENKAINLKAMEDELNLSEGGFIFIDDNPIERNTVKGVCPDVYVPDFPQDTTELIAFAESLWFDYCKPLRILQEDAAKTQMYQNEVKRKQDMSASLNLDDYIKKLEIKLDIHRMRADEFERTLQLINKTNQFNLTTKRYTQVELQNMAADENCRVYVVHSSDKYGNNGLIAVVILFLSETENKIDTFLMSCRVMGRKFEDVIIGKLVEKYGKHTNGNFQLDDSSLIEIPLIGEFIPTAKNAPVRNLYERMGFTLVEETESHKLYRLSTASNFFETDPSMLTGVFKEIKFDEN